MALVPPSRCVQPQLVETKAKERIQAVKQRCIAKDAADRPEFQEAEEGAEALINSTQALPGTMFKARQGGEGDGAGSLPSRVLELAKAARVMELVASLHACLSSPRRRGRWSR